MEPWIHLTWISTLLLMLVEVTSPAPTLGPFNPQNSADKQPSTFSHPPPNNNCSLYMPGTVWHFINHISGRCCRQIFIVNGTFDICDRNGGWDKFAECSSGSYNLKSPFYTGQYQHPNHAQDCQHKELKELVDALASLNVSWDNRRYMLKESTPVILLSGTVYSNSTPVKGAFLFRNNDTLPLGQMPYEMTRENHWSVHYILRNPGLEDSGVYRILVINGRSFAWSRDVTLTVLPSESTTTNQPTESPTTQAYDKRTRQYVSSSSPTSCMLMFVCMACMILRFIL